MRQKFLSTVLLASLILFVFASLAASQIIFIWGFDFDINNMEWRRVGLYDDGGLTPIPGSFSDDPAPWSSYRGSPNPGCILLGSGGFQFPPSPTGNKWLHWDLVSPSLIGNIQWQGITGFAYRINGEGITTLQRPIYVQAIVKIMHPVYPFSISYHTDGKWHEIPTEWKGSWQEHTVDVSSFPIPPVWGPANIILRIFFEAGSGHDGFVAVDHVVPIYGTADTCEGKCGQWDTSWSCNCDDQCQQYGDCCPDYEAQCGGTADSCEGKCGQWDTSWSCNCDNLCQQYGDCCPDYEAQCGGTADSCAGKCGQWDTSWSCNCDNLCQQYGDCCPDYEQQCGGTADTCVGKCGQYDKSWSCQCDNQCQQYGDCCPDYQQVCP